MIYEAEVDYIKDLLQQLYIASTDPSWTEKYWGSEDYDELLEEIADVLGIEGPEKDD